MPEGDTVHRAARRLDAALTGKLLTRCDVRAPQHATVDLSGETVEGTEAFGKHLVTRTATTSIHSHVKMEGVWHVYRRGDRWRRPAFEARIVLEAGDVQAVGFALGQLDLVPRAEEGTLIDHLGPDPLRDEFDRDEALARLTADPERPIGLALLDQRVIAGLGNDYRNETLFLRGVLPETPVGETDAAAALDLAVRLIRANRDRNERTTTGDTRRDKRLWVAHRDRKPCRRCGTPIRRGLLGEDALSERITWYCPSCQR
ncbi:DNA-formamidopyrimidine glycosylase family protein [Microcella alkaliphila]|uniref:DNA-(apurinic or apyrimidinic site) lyase n=1 Tax=Microcella alkaliphila TaxID=279828 RepID=A0A0U5BSH7_9MICO|nr:DNA-formamidopyrimidine glycosylase family protein [Microcella alkaliphila]BAU31325.1 formamidopyrimidine-DNA glycosylase [Microcella alkaliphila]